MAKSCPDLNKWAKLSVKMAPAVGLEPTTKRLTAARSTTELRRSEGRRARERPPTRAPSRRRSREYQKVRASPVCSDHARSGLEPSERARPDDPGRRPAP